MTLKGQLALVGAVAVAALLFDLYVVAPDPYYVSIALQMMLFALLAQGLNWIAGYAGRLAFGNVLFFGVGAYASQVGVVHEVYPASVGLLVGMSLSAVLAFGLNYALWQLDGLLFALVTFSLSLILQVVVTITPVLGRADGLSQPLTTEYSLVDLTLSSPNEYLLLGAALVLATTLLTSRVAVSRFGRQVQAVRDDRVAAATSGVNVKLMVGIVWAASAAFTALVGVYYAQYNSFIEPVSSFGVQTSVQMVFAAVIGGLGFAWGPIVGSAIIPAARLLNELAGPGRLPGINVLVYGVLLVLIVRLVPGGLLSLIPARKAARRVEQPIEPEAPEPEAPRASGSTTVPLLDVADLSKSFGGLSALSRVDLTTYEGEILGLVGPNGAGKTTLFNCITGVDPISSGRMTFAGTDISRMPPHQIARCGVARTYQVMRVFPTLTARDHAMIPLAARGIDAPDRVARVLRSVGLAERADDVVGDFSPVECRKLELARAIVAGTRLVLLDEAMVGLTEVESDAMGDLIRSVRAQLGVSFIVVEHVMDRIVTLVDRIVVMDHGEVIASGEPDVVLNSDAVLEAYFGVGAAHV